MCKAGRDPNRKGRTRTTLLSQDGANAAMVGILGAALHGPVFTSAISSPADFALALACFVAPGAWKAPPRTVVPAGASGGAALALVGRGLAFPGRAWSDCTL